MQFKKAARKHPSPLKCNVKLTDMIFFFIISIRHLPSILLLLYPVQLAQLFVLHQRPVPDIHLQKVLLRVPLQIPRPRRANNSRFNVQLWTHLAMFQRARKKLIILLSMYRPRVVKPSSYHLYRLHRLYKSFYIHLNHQTKKKRLAFWGVSLDPSSEETNECIESPSG